MVSVETYLPKKEVAETIDATRTNQYIDGWTPDKGCHQLRVNVLH